MRSSKKTSQDVLNIDVATMSTSIEAGDCFGTYLGTDLACINCHDSHACALLKQKFVLDAAKRREPVVSIGRDGLTDDDVVYGILKVGKMTVEVISDLQRSYPHLSEKLLSIKMKARVIALGLRIEGGKICK